jgi:hypothetical protein
MKTVIKSRLTKLKQAVDKVLYDGGLYKNLYEMWDKKKPNEEQFILHEDIGHALYNLCDYIPEDELESLGKAVNKILDLISKFEEGMTDEQRLEAM